MLNGFRSEVLVMFYQDLFSSLLAARQVCQGRHVRLISLNSSRCNAPVDIMSSVSTLVDLYGTSNITYCGNYCNTDIRRKLYERVYYTAIGELSCKYAQASIYDIKRFCDELSKIAIAISFAVANKIELVVLPYTVNMLPIIGGSSVYSELRDKANTLSCNLLLDDFTPTTSKDITDAAGEYFMNMYPPMSLVSRNVLSVDDNGVLDDLVLFWNTEIRDILYSSLDSLVDVFRYMKAG